MYESISKNNELENEMTLDMSYFWYSDVGKVVMHQGIVCLSFEGDILIILFIDIAFTTTCTQCMLPLIPLLTVT